MNFYVTKNVNKKGAFYMLKINIDNIMKFFSRGSLSYTGNL